MGKTSVKAIAVVLATICAVSAGATAITAGALSENRNENTAVSVRKAENFEIVIKACDWNYSADSLCVEITCDFDYAAKTAKFTAVGKKAGITNAVLKTKKDDGTWKSLDLKFVVDEDLNVTAKPNTPIYAEKKNDTVDEKKSETKTGKPFSVEFCGYDWNYSADSTNAVITCDFDYAEKNAKFTATGVKAGVTNAVLKVKAKDGKWNNIPMTFTVDDNLNVTGRMSGEPFVTER